MTESTTRTVNLMPEPGTEAYERMRQWMRQAFSDPRNVRFRREVTRDGANQAFLSQGGTDPLPEVKDPVRPAIEVQVTLLFDGVLPDPDKLARDMESLSGYSLAGWRVLDVLVADDPKQVSVLNAAYYRPGDHFTNPLDA